MAFSDLFIPGCMIFTTVCVGYQSVMLRRSIDLLVTLEFERKQSSKQSVSTPDHPGLMNTAPADMGRQ